MMHLVYDANDLLALSLVIIIVYSYSLGKKYLKQQSMG